MAQLQKLRDFFQAERQATAGIQAPDALYAQIQALAADHYMREQAATGTTPTTALTDQSAPLRATSPATALTDQSAPLRATTPASAPLKPSLKPLPRLNKRRPFPRAFAAAVALTAIIICAISLTLPASDMLPQGFSGLVEIKPAYAAIGGMDARAGFIISASQPLPAELVRQALDISPSFDYHLKEQDNSTYQVVPLQPLNGNTVYHVSFDPERAQEDLPQRAEYSWSFQTEPAFAITGVSPANRAGEVPAGASLVISLNKEAATAATELISIEPQTAGSWQAEGLTLCFTPQAGWEYGLLYTVRVAAELPAADGSLLTHSWSSTFFTEAAPAPSNAAAAFALTEQSAGGLTFMDGENPRFSLLTPQGDEASYLVNIYSLADAAAYADALYAGQGATAELPLAAAYELRPEAAADEVSWLTLPAPLPRGFYAAEISAKGSSASLLLQVSGLNAYAAFGATDSLFWLHDTYGQPVAAARISRWPELTEVGQTDETGLAVLAAAEDDPCARPIYCLQTEDDALVVAGGWPPQPPPATLPYRHYLYTENSYYSPGHSLRFFGVCETRGEEAPLSVRLQGPGLAEQALPYSVSVASGAFSGQLTLPGLREGWYELALFAGDDYLGGRYIQVGPPEARLYRLSIRPDVTAAWAGESVSWLVEAQGPEQALAGLTVLVEDETGAVSMELVTDAAGRAELILPAPVQNNEPYTVYSVRASAELPGQDTVTVSSAIYVLQYNAFVEAALSPLEPDSYSLQLTAFAQALPQMEAGGETAALPQALRQPLTETLNITATLLPTEAAEEEGAAETNMAENVPETELTAGELPLQISGSQPLFTQFVLPQAGPYELRLSGADLAGRPFELTMPLPARIEADSEAEPQPEPPLTLQDAYTAAGETHLYSADEQVELQLYRGEAPLSAEAAASGSSLFVLAGPHIAGAAVVAAGAAQAAAVSFTAQGAAYSWAVYYANGQYQATAALPLAVTAPAAARLTIHNELQSSANLLHLQLTDAAGEPLPATLNLQLLTQEPAELPQLDSLLRGENASPYQQLMLRGPGNAPVKAFITPPGAESLTAPAQEGQTESALFITLETDEQGFTSLELDPAVFESGPWFLLWQAYAPERQVAASGLIELDTRAPFFLSSRLAAPCQEGDAPVLLFKASGTELAPGATVFYEIDLPALDFQAEAAGSGGEWQQVELPALPAGEYELLISAASGPYLDEQTLSFAVLAAAGSAYELLQQPAQEGLPPLAEADEKVTVLFSAAERAADLAELFTLAAQDGVDLEHKLAARLAQTLLSHWGAGAEPEESSLALYQQADGGLALLPLSPSRRGLSALAVPLLADQVDRTALTAYLRRWYEQEEDETEQALALAGLAALNQPVLLEIARLLERQPTEQALLNLALACLSAGHGASAKALTLELMASHTAAEAGGLIRAANFPGADQQTLSQATAQLALLANVFELPEAQGLYAALLADSEAGFAHPLEQARILQARCLRLPSQAYFSYKLEENSQYVDLRDYACYRLTLSPSQAAALTVSEASGGVTVSVISPRQLGQAEGTETSWQLARSYRQQAEDVTLLQQGLTEVRLDFYLPAEAPAGWYQLSDTLPSGLSFCALDRQAGSRRLWLLKAANGQVSFNVYKGAGAFHGSAVYTALATLPGRYNAPAPTLQAVRQPARIALGLNQQVEIE